MASPVPNPTGLNTVVGQTARPELAVAIPKPEPKLKLPLITTSSGRIPALDGLRGIAILSVLLWHGLFALELHSKVFSGLLVVGRLSWSGVDLFFVLSGFLIGGILLDAKDSPRYFRTFYIRRGYRILPLYGIVVGVYIFRHLPFHLLPGRFGDFSPTPLPLASFPTFTQNFWMAYLGTFGSAAMAATWSLAVEEQFYLTVPLVIRKISRSRLAVFLTCVIIAAPLLRILAYYGFHHGDIASYVLMPCRADALCLGVLAALLVRDARARNSLIAKRIALFWITGVLLVALAWMTYQRYGTLAGPMVTIGYSLLALFYTGCLLIVLTDTGLVRRVLCNRRLMQLGGIAYCTYLLHMPAMEACRRLLGVWFRYASTATQFFGGLLGIALTLVIARLSLLFFEQPMLHRGHAYKY